MNNVALRPDGSFIGEIEGFEPSVELTHRGMTVGDKVHFRELIFLNMTSDDFALDHPQYRFPTHLVHPEHGKGMVCDVRGEAVCPDCNTLWRSNRDNTVDIASLR